MKISVNILLALSLFSHCVTASEKPNIIYILADDLGYGDVEVNNPQSKIPTPNLNKMAEMGMNFTDFHTNSAVCSPTRYSILTGRYSFRTPKRQGALRAYDPPMITKGTVTVPSFLRDNGYYTACIGKWHLGWNWPEKTEEELKSEANKERKNLKGYKFDFTKEFSDGPIDCGFDYFFGLSASLDIPPFCYFRGKKATVLPTKEVPYGVFSHYRQGLGDPNLKPEDTMLDLNKDITSFIKNHKKITSNKPFFIYYSLPAPHWPVAPAEQFIGKTEAGAYGDYVFEMDWLIGELYKALDQAGISENTLVMFTADNGASSYASGSAKRKGHKPSGQLRGSKSEIWEGGHRVPFLVTWPREIKGGSTNNDVFCTTDFFATCAQIIHKKLPEDVGADSVSMLAAFKGESKPQPRQGIIHHSGKGSFAIRKGKWKYIISSQRPKKDEQPIKGQLYDMDKDISETNNLAGQYPEIVKSLDTLLREIVENGRSTPGPKLENDVEVRIR